MRPRAPLFEDRIDAGRRLAREIAPPDEPAVVYGLARGGVPVAAIVAEALGAGLDALVVRKIGHPDHPEFALGALTRGHVVLMHGLDRQADGLRDHIDRVADEARRLDTQLHSQISPLDPRGMVAILVDDGLATGATMAAACEWARAGGATRVVVAVPVAAADSLSALGETADAVVCPHPIVDFHAVSLWYGDFSPVPMSEVIRLVRGAREGDATERRGA